MEEQLQSHPKVTDDAFGVVDVSTSSSQEAYDASNAGDDTVIPSAQFLKKTKHIQDAVDERLQELARINEQGRFQCGGNEQINVKHQVPWPQNYVFAGTSKSRVTYVSLSTFQWMAGFCSIIRGKKEYQGQWQMLKILAGHRPKVLMLLSSVGWRRVRLIG